MLIEVAALPFLPSKTDPPAVKLDDDVSLVCQRDGGSEIPGLLGTLAYAELVGGRCTRSMDPVDAVDLLLLTEAGGGVVGQPSCWTPEGELVEAGPLEWPPSTSPDRATEQSLLEQAGSPPLGPMCRGSHEGPVSGLSDPTPDVLPARDEIG